MRQVNIHQAKTRFSELVAAVEAGEEIVIARAGARVARLVPDRPPPRQYREGGAWKAGSWDETAWREGDREILADFEGAIEASDARNE